MTRQLLENQVLSDSHYFSKHVIIHSKIENSYEKTTMRCQHTSVLIFGSHRHVFFNFTFKFEPFQDQALSYKI